MILVKKATIKKFLLGAATFRIRDGAEPVASEPAGIAALPPDVPHFRTSPCAPRPCFFSVSVEYYFPIRLMASLAKNL